MKHDPADEEARTWAVVSLTVFTCCMALLLTAAAWLAFR